MRPCSDGLPVPQRYGAILAIALGITVSVLDGAIANVALPTIARDLNASPASSIWVVNAYQLAITVSLLSLASLGDLIGYRRIYQAGLLVFSITSLFCALSDSLLTLTIARVLQGFWRRCHHERQHRADPHHLSAAFSRPRHGHQFADRRLLLGGRADGGGGDPVGRVLAVAVRH